MRKQNVVIFSAGESVRNGHVEYIKNTLSHHHIDCTIWNDLFHTARDLNNIALLPLLIKKIPTFDFALIVAEGVDKVHLRHNESVKSMRDNVIFEIGLCIMALGLERVILFSEEGLRMPEDLIGKGKIGIHQVEFQLHNIDSKILEVESIIKQENIIDSDINKIASYILAKAQHMSPVYVGASVALAESYFHNFLLRLITYLDQPIMTSQHQKIKIDLDKININIFLPTLLTDDIKLKIKDYYYHNNYESFSIQNAGTRDLFFKAKFEQDYFVITDIPTSITASYSIVNTILSLDSDDQFDFHAKERFMIKEVDMFEYALKRFLSDEKLMQSYMKENDSDFYHKLQKRFSHVCLQKIEI